MAIVQVLVSDLTRTFPSEERITWSRCQCDLARALFRIALSLPPGTYMYAQLVQLATYDALVIFFETYELRRSSIHNVTRALADGTRTMREHVQASKARPIYKPSALLEGGDEII
jgi:hypothetical protein